MRIHIFVLTLMFCLLMPANIVYAGFWNNVGKSIHIWVKNDIKQTNKENERRAKERAKQQAKWEKEKPKRDRAINDHLNQKEFEEFKESGSSRLKDELLNRPWLQKIEVYKEILKKFPNRDSVIDIIDHISKYGVNKYGEKLSQQHKDLLKVLHEILTRLDQEKGGSQELIIIDEKTKHPDKFKGAKDGAIGLTILGGLAYIFRVVVFKVPI